MIYSRFRPDSGLYDYFQSPERVGLGDDLSVPRLSSESPIGVASTDIGRSAPGPLTFLGQGHYGRGQILPLARLGLSGALLPSFPPFIWLGLGVLVGWWVAKRRP